jgi:hypothetical protein
MDDPFGLLDGVTINDLVSENLIRDGSQLTNPPANTLMAVARIDLGPLTYDDDYKGFDMLVVINLTELDLPNPMLGVSVNGSSPDYLQALKVRGADYNDDFGGAGGAQNLGALGAQGIWAMLVPDSATNPSIHVNARIDGLVSELEGVQLRKGEVSFIEIAPDVAPSVDEALQGLNELVTDTDPSVSMAGRRRTMALRRAIACTPTARVIVSTAGRPSGMAATDRPTTAMNNSAKSCPPKK